MNLDEKAYPPRNVLGYISRAKDKHDPGARTISRGQSSPVTSGRFKIAKIYAEYERRLWEAGRPGL